MSSYKYEHLLLYIKNDPNIYVGKYKVLYIFSYIIML